MKSVLFFIFVLGCISTQAESGPSVAYGKELILLGRLVTLHDSSGDFFGLKVDHPLDFTPSSDPELAETDLPQRNVTEVQLVGYSGFFVPLLNALQGTEVSLEGSFLGKHTVHHVRPVLFALKGDTLRDTQGFSVSVSEEKSPEIGFDQELANYGSSVTYQRKAENWYVISGVINDQEYYLKVLSAGPDDPALKLLIQYPHALDTQYEKIVLILSRSFER